MVFAIALTIAIKDIPAATATDSPVALILRDQLGVVMERSLLFAIVIAFFGAGTVTLATCANGFRDGARRSLPGPRLMQRVSRAPTPIPATVLIVVLGIALIAAVPGDALLELLTVSGLIGATLYGAIIVLYLAVRKRLGRQEDAFDIGRFEMPVAIGALIWSAIVIAILVSPPEAHTAVVIALGILLAGGGYFGYLFVVNREVLETEPGDADVFKH